MYEIKIAGKVNKFGYSTNFIPTLTNSYKDYDTLTEYLTGLKQWGELEATQYGFSSCANLSSAIPEPTENSFRNLTSCTFYACRGLSGSIPGELFANTSSVTNFKWVFCNCSGLTGSIPAELFANTPNVTDFSLAFYRCSGLTGNIPEKLFSNTKNVSDFERTFSSCNSLTGGFLDINTDVVTDMDYMFYACYNLKSLVFGKNVKKLTGKDMFTDCNKLESIIMLYHVEEQT